MTQQMTLDLIQRLCHLMYVIRFFQIMAEPYESIGNRVMRHFRHVTDSTVHYWLPGNHIEPLELGEDIPGPSGLAHQSTSRDIPPSVDPHYNTSRF